MAILRNTIDKHLADPALLEAFQGVYAIHPNWERPDWVVKRMIARIREGKEDTPIDDAG
jgi:hypothetical protein